MTLMWMGLLVIILAGAWHNALTTKHDGVGDFYSVSMGEQKEGRVTFALSCSDSNKNFLITLVLDDLENISGFDLEIEYQEIPNTLYLGVQPGETFIRSTIQQLESAIAYHKENRAMEERLLITHDLFQFVYDQSSMKITQRGNFHVDYAVERKLISLGATL